MNQFLTYVSDTINEKYIIQQFKTVLQTIKSNNFTSTLTEGMDNHEVINENYTIYEFIYVNNTIIKIFKFSIHPGKIVDLTAIIQFA